MGIEANTSLKGSGATDLAKAAAIPSQEAAASTSESASKKTNGESAYSGGVGYPSDYSGAWGISLFGFSNPLAKRNPLDAEIDRLKASLKIISGPDQEAAFKRLRELQQGKKALEVVDQLVIYRKDVRALIDEARRGLTNGALQSDKKTYDNAVRLVNALLKYQEAEKNRIRIGQGVAALYPKDSPDVFKLDFTGRKEDKFGPSNEFLNKLTVKKTYDKFVESTDDADFEVRLKVEEVFEDLRATQDLYAPPAKNGEFGQCSSLTIEDVEAYTQELNDLYQSPELKTFFTKLQEIEKESFKDNEGFRARQDYSEAIQSLKLIDACLVQFAKYESEDLKGLTPEKLTAGKTFLETRVKAYQTFLLEERKRVKLENGWAGLTDQACTNGEMGTGTSNLAIFEWQRLNVELKKVDALLASLGKIETKFTDASSKKEAFAALKQAATEARGLEEAHVRGSLETMIGQLKKLPSSDTKLALIEADFAKITPETMSDPEARIKAYGEILSRLQRVAVVRTVDARIKMYEDYQSELKAGDRWLDVSHTIAYGVTLGLVGPRDDYEVPGLEDVAKVLAKYRGIRNLVASDNESDRAEGLKAFGNLEAGTIHKTLQGDYEKVATLNQFTIGVGIVLASAFTAGMASAALSPFLAGTAFGGEILFGVNVLTFSASTHIYRSPFYGTKELGKLASLDFAGELVMNAAMFKYLGKAMETFEKYFEKGLEVASRGNMEVLRKSLGIKIGKAMGAFAYEGIKFQQWDFYVTAGRLALKGEKDPIGRALSLSTSVKSLTHSFAFLFMLKAGGALQEPLTVKIHEGMKDLLLGPEFEAYFKGLNERIEGLRAGLEHFAETGKGNPSELLKLYEQSLLEQEAVLKKLPAGYRNEALVERNKALLGELFGFKVASTLFLGIFGEGNRFGVKSSTSPSSFAYDPAKQASLVSTLESHAWVEPGSVVAMAGGKVRAQFVNADGQLMDVEFKPAYSPALPQKTNLSPAISIVF